MNNMQLSEICAVYPYIDPESEEEKIEEEVAYYY